MSVGLFFDVHVDTAIAAQLRLRQVDVLTAQDEGVERLPDDRLLAHASQLRRPIITHDIRFKAMAETWQRQQRPFFGMIFGHLMRAYRSDNVSATLS